MERKEEYVKISPRDFINGPYIKCPKCGKNSFGILMICDHHYCRRCTECYYPHPSRGENGDLYPLPELNKKIIYLDQFAISEMAKAKKDLSQRKYWLELYNLIDGLVLEQIIVCPDSIYHEEESELSESIGKDLKNFYEQMSRGITFNHPHEIRSQQIYQSLKKFVGEDTSKDYDFSDWNNAFNKNPNSWQDKFHIRTNIKKDPEEILQRRARKEEHLKIMKEHFRELPCREKFDFYKEVRVWQEAHSYSILKLYSDYIRSFIEMRLGIKPFDPMWVLNSPTVTELAEQILDFFKERNIVNRIEQIDKLKEFLCSEYFYNTPHVLIGSLFNAGISRKFVYGARKEPKSGDNYDVQIISHLLPYCNAMLIDNETRAILTEEPINLEKKFKIRLFSMSKNDDFINYLHELKRQTTEGISNAVIEVYGELHTTSRKS